MRSFPIEMSKASHKRLFLLANNDDLPIPLERAEIEPFWFRIADAHFILTHQGRDVAYLAPIREYDHHNKSVLINTPMQENARIDGSIKQAFQSMIRHLNGVGSVLARAERERKIAEEEVAEVENARHAAEKVAAEARIAKFLGDEHHACLTALTLQEISLVFNTTWGDNEDFATHGYGCDSPTTIANAYGRGFSLPSAAT